MVLRAQGLVLVCEDIVRREKLVVLVVSRQSDANLLRLLQAEDFHCIVVRPNLPGFHCSVMKGFLGCIIHRLPTVLLARLYCKGFMFIQLSLTLGPLDAKSLMQEPLTSGWHWPAPIP